MPTIRPTREEDLKELGELLDGIFRRPRGITDQSMLTDFPLVFAPANWRNGRVVFEDGRLVAHAALWPREAIIEDERLVLGVLVSVATHPDYRQRGYAALAVESLQSQMHDEEYDLGLLWTGVPDFYLKLGWEVVEDRGTTIDLDPARLPRTPFNMEVERFDPQRHAEAVYALHERETIRFRRSPEQAGALFALSKIETWVATRAEEVIGYLVHANGCNKRGLVEYGGLLEAVTRLACHVALRQPPDVPLPLLAYHARPDLVEWARELGLPLTPLSSSKGFGHEMILAARGQPIPPRHRRALFAWGLDQA